MIFPMFLAYLKTFETDAPPSTKKTFPLTNEQNEQAVPKKVAEVLPIVWGQGKMQSSRRRKLEPSKIIFTLWSGYLLVGHPR